VMSIETRRASVVVRERERERERRESTKTTINNYASIAIAAGDAACGWRAEN
jgi:hypothetical protein